MASQPEHREPQAVENANFLERCRVAWLKFPTESLTTFFDHLTIHDLLKDKDKDYEVPKWHEDERKKISEIVKQRLTRYSIPEERIDFLIEKLRTNVATIQSRCVNKGYPLSGKQEEYYRHFLIFGLQEMPINLDIVPGCNITGQLFNFKIQHLAFYHLTPQFDANDYTNMFENSISDEINTSVLIKDRNYEPISYDLFRILATDIRVDSGRMQILARGPYLLSTDGYYNEEAAPLDLPGNVEAVQGNRGQENDEVIRQEDDEMIRQENDEVIRQEDDEMIRQDDDEMIRQENDEVIRQEDDEMIRQEDDEMIRQENDEVIRQEDDEMIREDDDEMIEDEEEDEVPFIGEVPLDLSVNSNVQNHGEQEDDEMMEHEEDENNQFDIDGNRNDLDEFNEQNQYHPIDQFHGANYNGRFDYQNQQNGQFEGDQQEIEDVDDQNIDVNQDNEPLVDDGEQVPNPEHGVEGALNEGVIDEAPVVVASMEVEHQWAAALPRNSLFLVRQYHDQFTLTDNLRVCYNCGQVFTSNIGLFQHVYSYQHIGYFIEDPLEHRFRSSKRPSFQGAECKGKQIHKSELRYLVKFPGVRQRSYYLVNEIPPDMVWEYERAQTRPFDGPQLRSTPESAVEAGRNVRKHPFHVGWTIAFEGHFEAEGLKALVLRDNGFVTYDILDQATQQQVLNNVYMPMDNIVKNQ